VDGVVAAARPAGPDFFISRAGPDAAFAVKIAHILEALDYRVIIQDRDIVNQSFVAAMQAALTSGARTIALLSHDYLDPARVHCAAEWQATIADDPLNTHRKLIVLRVAECAPPGLLKSLAYWDLVRVGGDDQLLADIVAHAVDPNAGAALPEAVARYWREARTLVHPEIRATSNFVDHDGALDRVDQSLWHGAARIAGITQPVATHGMGGVGKSTLAREYAFQASQAANGYAGIWWLGAARDRSAKSYDGVESALLELRATLYPGLEPPRERAQAARGMLEHIAHGGTAKPWLLIYDNVDDMGVLQVWKPPANAHVLLTTRLTTFRKGEVAAIAIEEWALPDAVRYLIHESGRGDIAESGAEAIAQALGRLPLALSHASAYLREVPTASAASYLAAIERRMKSAPPGMADAKPVYATFQEAIAQAEAQARGAAAVMAFAALLAPDNIPTELFAQDAELYPAALAAIVADPDGIEAATGALARYSLIDFDRDANVFSVHRLVQAAAVDGLPAADRSDWLAAAVAAINAAHPGDEFKHWAAYERLLPHVLVLADSASEAAAEPLALLLARAGYYLKAQGKYDLAEPLYKRDLAISETALGPDHPDVGTSLNNLAALYVAQGKYDLAERLYLRSLRLRETALGPDHPSVGTSLNNLAGLYRAQGKYDLAEPLYLRSLRLRETALGPDHPDVGTSVGNLAGLLIATGRLDDALPLRKRELEIMERALPDGHPHIGTACGNLAGLYRAQGKYDLAEPLYKRSLAIHETALGPDHPNTAITLWNMADLFARTDRLDEAAGLAQRAVAILERALGAGHPDTKGAAQLLAAINSARNE
jgi:hypothetical protein